MKRYAVKGEAGKSQCQVSPVSHLRGLRWILPCLLLFCTQCGYRLKHRLQDAFQAPRGIYVPVFRNKSDEIGAERVFTNALIRELLSRREVIVASQKSGALELKGSIDSLRSDFTAYSGAGFGGLQAYRRVPSEVRVTVGLSIELRNPDTTRVLWRRTFKTSRKVEVPTDRTWDVDAPSANGLRTQSVVESLYPEVARDIMRDVYDEMVELF